MLISEIFYSIQGEGELTGVPSVFIRTSGCNLRCNWCDTMYASWQPEGDETCLKEILRKVDSYPAQHCVLTGGEPMIAKGIHELAKALRQRGKHITIETAATVTPAGIACDLASLSPKLANSTPDNRLPESWRARHESLRWNPEIVRQWMDHTQFQLKLVISSAADVEEMQSLLRELNRKVLPTKVLLMAEGTSSEVITKHSGTLLEICKRHGYRYCSRLHIELFGHTRGT